MSDEKAGPQLKSDFGYSVWEAECENGHKSYYEDEPGMSCPECPGKLYGLVRLVPDWEVWEVQLEAAGELEKKESSA